MLTRCEGCERELSYSMDGISGVCPTCSHVSVLKELKPTLYDQSYLAEYRRRGETELGRKINRERWSLVQRYMPHSSQILDWGCGDGAFIRSKENGHYVDGYDINPNSPFYDNHRLYLGRWDAVTLWDVIEHLKHPSDFLRKLRTEWLFISTPNVASVNGAVLKDWKHWKPEEHQHLFSEASLYRMLSRTGFRVIEISNEEGALRDPQHPEAIITIVGRKN